MTPPIACCLDASDFRTRITWIKDLTRRALQSHVRHDLVLQLCYVADAAAEVHMLVEQERLCCAFLTFDMDRIPGAVRVTITAPEAVRDCADALFELFLGGLVPP
jgi:hypothetical protein